MSSSFDIDIIPQRAVDEARGRLRMNYRRYSPQYAAIADSFFDKYDAALSEWITEHINSPKAMEPPSIGDSKYQYAQKCLATAMYYENVSTAYYLLLELALISLYTQCVYTTAKALGADDGGS
jgi:hypothetical protein